MMSRKFSLLPMIALICLIFIGLTQTAPLNKRGATAIADFNNGISGESSFISSGSVTILGQFNRGFESKNVKDYGFLIVDDKGHVKMDLTKEVGGQMYINVPGTSPFRVYLKDANLMKDFVNNYFLVTFKGKKLGEAKIIHDNPHSTYGN